MWVDFKKVKETENGIMYNYAYCSHNLTGIIEYNKKDGQTYITRQSNESDFPDFVMRCFQKVISENFPQERMVAIG